MRHSAQQLGDIAGAPLASHQKSSRGSNRREKLVEDLCAALAVTVMGVVLVLGAAVGVASRDRAAAACTAAGGHIYNSYVDQIRCIP